MHNSDSQEELVDEYMKYEVSDALIYKEFDYDKTEWDNIPSLIPRFVTFLSKHMESLTKICHERFTQISTPDLQLIMEEKLANLENKVNILLSEGSAARQALAERVAKLESETNNLKNESENMKRTQKEQCTTDLKKIIPIPTEEDYIKEFEKEEQMADEEAKGNISENSKNIEKGTKDDESDEPPNQSGIILKEKEWFKGKNNFNDFDTPRSFTLNQIKDLVYLHLSRSDFKKRFVSQNNLLRIHEESLEEISQYRMQLSEDLKNEFNSCSKEIEQNYSALEEYKENADRTHKDMQERISSNFQRCMTLSNQHDEHKGFLNVINSKIEKISNRVTNFNTTYTTKFTEINESLENKFKTLKVAFNTESESVANQFEKIKKLCKELIDLNKDSIIGIVETSNESVKENLEAIKVKLEKSMQEVIVKNRSQIIKIKDICTKYFEKNDDVMKTMQDKVKIVDSTFSEFLNNVIKPQQFSEARLFTVETRLKEEEDLRILEVSHIKDVI